MIGVIDPGAEMAYRVTKSKKIGIIGTFATIQSKAYETALQHLDNTIITTAIACPLFVPLAEEGWLAGDVPLTVDNGCIPK